MKTRTLISILILVFAVLIIIGSCATDKMTYISKEYEIYGTWVNPEYEKKGLRPKVVYNPNGKIDSYPSIDATRSLVQEFVITNRWTDSDGNVLYTCRIRFEDNWQYILFKLSNSGKTLESIFSVNDYPFEIDSSNANYRIRYRQ